MGENPLPKETKAVLFALTTLVAGPYAILRGGAGLTAALWRARLIIAAGMGFGISSSPRGGGPGHSPISTNTPPSFEEVGQFIVDSDASARTGKLVQIGAPKKKCPPGYIWSWKKQRCVHVHGRGRKYFRKD